VAGLIIDPTPHYLLLSPITGYPYACSWDRAWLQRVADERNRTLPPHAAWPARVVEHELGRCPQCYGRSRDDRPDGVAAQDQRQALLRTFFSP
jgi:hypothetical protein